MPVSSKTQKSVWGKFAGRCAICREFLIHETDLGNRSLIGEVAHIVGERKNAARGHSDLSLRERNEIDNLLLLCRPHHKIVDDNPSEYPVARLREIGLSHFSWLEGQLADVSPWNCGLSSILYLNVPRLSEYAAINGFSIPVRISPEIGRLKDLGLELVSLMGAFDRVFRNMPIDSLPLNEIKFPHERYVGGLVRFDRQAFRTRNIDIMNSEAGRAFEFTGDLDVDPHIYVKLNGWKLVILIDRRWITTSTAHTEFRPTSGQSLFTGFARIKQFDLEKGILLASGLAIGLPIAQFSGRKKQDIDAKTERALLEQSEDDVTKARNRKWCGDIKKCDFCGKHFDDQLYMIDGPMVPDGPWGCLCELCYLQNKLPFGPGKGQLYRRVEGEWLLVGGYPIKNYGFEDED